MVPVIQSQIQKTALWHRSVSIPTSQGMMPITLYPGQVTLVAGPNGTGKSALIHLIYKQVGAANQAEYFPGHRQIYFSNEHYDYMQQPLDQLANNLYSHDSVAGRFRSAWSEDHLKSVLRRLLNNEFDVNAQIAAAVREDNRQAVEEMRRRKGPLETLNAIFEMGRIPIQFVIDNGQIRACRGGDPYGVDRLSDGERASLLLASAVIVRPLNGCIVVDEPEKHLNPGISGAFIAATVRARPDLAFVFASHDLNLIEWLSPTNIIHVRNSTVVEPKGDQRVFDVHLLDSGDGLPDDLKLSILGARKDVLFIEGTSTSDDRALFSLMFPNWHIVPSGGWESVATYVRSLKENAAYHWLRVKGLIDGDGRDEYERSQLESDSIFCIDAPTVENLFCLPDVIRCMAKVMADFDSRRDSGALISQVEAELPVLITRETEAIACLRTVWRVNRLVSSSKISVRSMQDGQTEVPAIDVKGAMSEALEEVRSTISEGALDALGQLPIKNTPIPALIASKLGYSGFQQYKAAIIRQIELGSEIGDQIKSLMARRLPNLELSEFIEPSIAFVNPQHDHVP